MGARFGRLGLSAIAASLVIPGWLIAAKAQTIYPSPPRGVKGTYSSKDCRVQHKMVSGVTKHKVCCTFTYVNPKQTVGPMCTGWH